MNVELRDNKKFPEDEFDEYIPQTAFHRSMRKTPWWATSVAFHGLILLCLYLIQWAVIDGKGRDIPMMTEIARQEEKLEEKKEEKIFEKKDLVRDTVEKDLPEVDDVVVDRVFEETIANTDAVGDTDMLSDVDLGGDGHVGTMGLGGGGMSGLFGSRGGGKKRAIAKYGGKGTLGAVERGLEWLKRHQCPDGSWSTQNFVNQCTDPNSQCRKGTGTIKNDIYARYALTALGTLCFLGAGYTHKTGKYRKTVGKALDLILSAQDDDGGFTKGVHGYTPGYCALALIEAYGMTRDPKLKKAVEKATHYMIEIHQTPGRAWRYKPRSVTNDTSVSAAFVMAVKDAKVCGIKADYKKSFDGIRNRFKQIGQGEHGGLGVYEDGERFVKPTCTGILMLTNQFTGMKRNNPTMKESAAYLAKVGPAWYNEGQVRPVEHSYYVYYATLAMFQYGGKEWKKWNKEMKKRVLAGQVKGGCADGSWVCANGREKPGFIYRLDTAAGKVFATSMAILTLEVYYRYSPLFR